MRLLQQSDISIIHVSSLYETNPQGKIRYRNISIPIFSIQQKYLNCVLEAITPLSPGDLLKKTQAIEKTLGRKRIAGFENLPRTIDIDILFYNGNIIHQLRLEIPHPRLHERNFVLVPFLEIAPDFVHPVYKKTIRQLSETVCKNGVRLWSNKIWKTSA